MFLAFALVSALVVAPQDTIAPSPAITGQAPAPAIGPVLQQPAGIGAPKNPAVAAAAPAAEDAATPVAADDTTPARRRKAFEISDAYAVRLKIHYIASFAMIPIFAGQAIVGQQLYNQYTTGQPISRSLLTAHQDIAWSLGALFLTNGVTGGWNWWETRHEAKGRPWRTVHAALMLVAEAGFAYTASLGERVHAGEVRPDYHRQLAETSAGVALLSYIMMWKPIRGDK